MRQPSRYLIPPFNANITGNNFKQLHNNQNVLCEFLRISVSWCFTCSSLWENSEVCLKQFNFFSWKGNTH